MIERSQRSVNHVRGVLIAGLAICLSVSNGLASTVKPQQSASAQGKPKPNMVILVADDWGFTDLGAFGGEIATPNLDALAHRGVRFSNFHTAASCSPTRSMLLTGVESHRAGIGNLRESTPRAHFSSPAYQGSLSQRVVTVSSLLKDNGYRTYITGKWNVGSEPHTLPPQRGLHAGACLFQRSASGAAGGVRAGRVRPARKAFEHGLARRRKQRRGGGMIEVNRGHRGTLAGMIAFEATVSI